MGRIGVYYIYIKYPSIYQSIFFNKNSYKKQHKCNSNVFIVSQGIQKNSNLTAKSSKCKQCTINSYSLEIYCALKSSLRDDET